MKTIGLIGGTTPESTVEYYRLLNEGARSRLGGVHGAKILLYSVDLQELVDMQEREGWSSSAAFIANEARRLELAGADMLLLGANTLHLVAPAVEQQISIPLIHISRAVGEEVKKRGLSKVALLGTRFTMTETFYTDILEGEFGIQSLIPKNEDDIQFLHSIIFEELAKGIFSEPTRRRFLEIVDKLKDRGAQGVILGCTEFPLLVKPQHTDLPLFDTTAIHVEAALSRAFDAVPA